MNASNSPWTRVRPIVSAVAALLLPSLPFVASSCSTETGGGVFINPGGSTGMAQGGGGGASGAGSSMGGATVSAGGVMITPPPPTMEGGRGGMIEADASCAKGMTKATLTPVNMFIQFDRSSSMNDDNKWPQASQALTGFFSDPQTAGLRVALRFFPHDLPAPGCTGGENGACDVMACSQPIVPLGELTMDAAPTDAQEGLLVTSVQNSAPPATMMGGGMGAGTPIYAALAGALTWARGHRAMAPTDRTVVVLVTDGEPNGCDEDIGRIAMLASDALAQDQIMTYAVGIAGASEAQMNQIAVAGGTMRAYFAGNASTAQQDLIAALNAIRGSALSCDFPMPTGMNVDPALVNVNFTPGGGMVEVIGQATDAQNCQNGGWYYDNPAMPTRIFLCPSTCARAQADGSAQLDIVLGCKAVPVPPPL